jgi:hypothetical protein
VPASWRTFQDPDGTYRLSFPPTWTPTDRGPFIDFTEPGGERFFRVQPTTDGMAPLTAQRSLERSFMARHPGDDYRRIDYGILARLDVVLEQHRAGPDAGRQDQLEVHQARLVVGCAVDGWRRSKRIR